MNQPLHSAEYRLECLYRQIIAWPTETRDRFFAMYTKVHGAAKTESLKESARQHYRDEKRNSAHSATISG